MMELLSLPELAGCLNFDCEVELRARCPRYLSQGGAPSHSHGGHGASVGKHGANRIDEVCDASCAPAFASAEGCEVMQRNDVAGVMDLMSSSSLTVYQASNCGEVLLAHCFPEVAGGSCEECIDDFHAAGVCTA